MNRYRDILAYPGTAAAAKLQRYHRLLNHWRDEMERAEDVTRHLQGANHHTIVQAIKRFERAEEFYRHWRDKYYTLQKELENARK